MKFISKEVRIGIAGVASLFVLVYGISYLKGLNIFKSASTYVVRFDNIDGLSKSAPVYADGVKVGIVRNIDYDFVNPENVYLEIEVDTEMRIPKGSTAELIPQLMGEVKMNLLLANNPREKYQLGDTLEGTLNGGAFESVSKMVPQFMVMLPKIDSILISLNTILSDSTIPSTMKSVANATSNLAVISKDLKGFMKHDVPQLSSKLNTLSDNFIAVSEQLKGINYKGIAENIDLTLTNVKEITNKINDKNSTMGLLFNDPALYNNLNETAINASNLLLNLKEEPKRYVHFSLFGGRNK